MTRLARFFLLLLCGSRLCAQTPLTVECETDREFYSEGAKTSVNAEIRIKAGGNSTIRSPRNVAFVLDRSGSMAGERWQSVRSAIAAGLAVLRDEDLVSVVVFGSEVETLVESRPKAGLAGLDAQLAQVDIGGGAATYDALNQAAALLRRNAGPTAISLVVLVTDGPATKGPRELTDFARLSAVLADERIAISTIGVGPDFGEDMLAALSRPAQGTFRFCAQPDEMAAAMGAVLALPDALAGRDAVLTVEILEDCEEVRSYGSIPSTIKTRTASFRLPSLYSGQTVSVLVGATMWPRNFSYRFARVHLAWTSVPDGEKREIDNFIEARVERDSSVLRDAANAPVLRRVADAIVSDGLQDAIEQIDKGDFRRALRELRRARSDAHDLNYRVDDAEIAGLIDKFDRYLNEVKGRGLDQLDRKRLRSGLGNQFSIPVAEGPVPP